MPFVALGPECNFGATLAPRHEDQHLTRRPFKGGRARPDAILQEVGLGRFCLERAAPYREVPEGGAINPVGLMGANGADRCIWANGEHSFKFAFFTKSRGVPCSKYT